MTTLFFVHWNFFFPEQKQNVCTNGKTVKEIFSLLYRPPTPPPHPAPMRTHIITTGALVTPKRGKKSKAILGLSSLNRSTVRAFVQDLLYGYNSTRALIGCWAGIIFFYYMAKLRERARWTKSRAVIGYPSGQDKAILPARDYLLYPASKISPKAI